MLDAIIVGGGAAGLAAAAELARAGASFVLLEARGRLGGRAWTVRAGGHRVELGAEFVHGRTAPVLRELRRAGLHRRSVSVRDEAYWKALEDTLGTLSDLRRDAPFREALGRIPGLEPRRREEALSFVRSFHAADPDRIGALEAAGESTQGAADSYRIPEGYGALISALAGRLPRKSVFLNAAVDRIRWSPGRASVRSSAGEFEAAAAVVTLPLGVLRARAVRFDPALPGEKKRALSALEMGVVAKVGLLLEPAAWRRAAAAVGGGFLRDERGPFDVYWTARPLEAPLITAWSGGPPARRLCALGRRAAVDAAIAGFARAAGLGEAFVRRGVARTFFHDWLSDPHARGAYAYARPGGQPARAALARPVARTLFFAGEACARGAGGGTVGGALETGREAARLLLSGPERPSSDRRGRPRNRGIGPSRRPKRGRRRAPAARLDKKREGSR